MKLTKFPQSSVLIETNSIKILIDPSTTKYDEEFLKYWKTADIVLITHRHSDHINPEALEKLTVPIYSTSEVAKHYPNLNIKIVKEGELLKFNNVKIEVVKAIHGYVMQKGEVKENVGFIIDDGKIKLWITSDTIRFKHDYMADVMFANITAFDASMNLWGAGVTYDEVGAKLMIVAHQDSGKMLYDIEKIKSYLESLNVNYIIPDILETFEI